MKTELSFEERMTKRLQKEIQECIKSPPENCSAGPVTDKDLTKWKATIIGPVGTPYEGGTFQLTMDLGDNYPMVPPKIKFTTMIFHPNISNNGDICLNILKTHEWSPTISINKLLLSICSLLNEPNFDDPLNISVVMVKSNGGMEAFKNMAREYTLKYAS